MKLKFGTKTKEDEKVFVKVVADPTVDETKWLPAMEVLGNKEIVAPEPDCPVAPAPKQSKMRSVATFTGSLLTFCVLVLGQVFMVSASAVATGKVAESLFGLKYESVMYLCGPQDTYLGIFIFAALPIFWTAWYLKKRRFLKYIAFCTFGLLIGYSIGGAIFPFSAGLQLGVSALTLVLSCLFHLSGSFLSAFRAYWPRSFSVSKSLLLCYIPAIVVFAYEFRDLQKPLNESVFVSVLLIAAFALLPAFLTGRSSGTKRYGSALGLAMIGQLPLLGSMLIYCIGNAVMLGSVYVFGGEAVGKFFEEMARGVFPPDFVFTSTSIAELYGKLASSLIVLGSLVASVCGGSYLAVLANQASQRKRIEGCFGVIRRDSA